MNRICKKCGRMLDSNEFYSSKHPPGRLHICKECIINSIDNQNPDTFKWVLQQVDVPYIEDEWNRLIKKHGVDGIIISRYLAKMWLAGFRGFTYFDTMWLNKKRQEDKP